MKCTNYSKKAETKWGKEPGKERKRIKELNWSVKLHMKIRAKIKYGWFLWKSLNT